MIRMSCVPVAPQPYRQHLCKSQQKCPQRCRQAHRTIIASASGSPPADAGQLSTVVQSPGMTPIMLKSGNGLLAVSVRPLPRVLVIHTGGTLGMDSEASFEHDTEGHLQLKQGTGGSFKGALKPGDMLANLLNVVPELKTFANLELKIAFNKDSSRCGPKEWQLLARMLDRNRPHFDAFLLIHGTDTMAFSASAISLMLQGFRKPIVLTGSQLPLSQPRSDARQNLIDSITVATAWFHPPHVHLEEVAICFGGKLMRGNRCQKVNSSSYQAFDSPGYPQLAILGIEIDWQAKHLLQVEGTYRPRFGLVPAVMRIPVVPGLDPRQLYGDLYGRGVRGCVLESFGCGNLPDLPVQGWIPWLKQQRKLGLKVLLSTQCTTGGLNPDLYQSGAAAMEMGAEVVRQNMTPECACVKLMQHLAYPDLPLGVPWAGEC